MPRKSAIKCYFGCATEGPFHQFPKPEYPNMDRFNKWKRVLGQNEQNKSNYFIYYNIKLCDHHFEDFYRSVSKRLTRHAVPTLNTSSTSQTVLSPLAKEATLAPGNILQTDLSSISVLSMHNTLRW